MAARASFAHVKLLPYLLLGTAFGVVLTQCEVVSWYRIQEMFRFQSFHIYGILGGALAVAAPGIAIIKRMRVTPIQGGEVDLSQKAWKGIGARYWVGGAVFGMGWAMTGGCPGPLFALLGNGVLVYSVVIVSALLGTWTYAHVRGRLPH